VSHVSESETVTLTWDSYRRRWRIERLFAWLHWFRRLVTRWEYHIENFVGMVRLGCVKLLLRHI
jgi:transposase